MPTLPELEAKVDELNEALQLEQQQVADAIAAKDAAIAERDTAIAEKDAIIVARDAAIVALNETIAALEAAGGTDDQRAALLEKLNGIKTDLEGTV